MADGEHQPDARDEAPSGEEIPQGRVSRAAPLAALSARTAGEALVAGARSRLTGADTADFHARTAERYAALLGRSRGALMKAGQMLSFVSGSRAIPDEFQAIYQAALSRLCTDAVPMAGATALAVLEHELGRPCESAFAQFDPRPVAAASIGQVHRATLHDGRLVAVKIQYPGVASAIDADVKNGELLAALLGLVFSLSPKRLSVDVRGAAREIGERIRDELDYGLEAATQSEFADIYRGHPFIHVPDVVAELSTRRVLTQEFVAGKDWSEAVRAEQALRDRWGEAIYRFVYATNYRFGLFHADPNPGNYVLHDDGRVSFLDFGCVKRFAREQVDAMNAVGRACLRDDVLGTWRASVEGGFWRSCDPVTPEEIFAYWRDGWEHWWAEQPFTITPEFVAAWIERRFSFAGPTANAFRYCTAPSDYAVMGRIEIGEASLLAQLRATNDWRAIVCECFEDAEPLTAMGKLEHEFFAARSGGAGTR